MLGLTYLASLVQYISATTVHPVFFPFPWITTLHAARITHAYRVRIKVSGNGGRISAGPEYAGFLLMVRFNEEGVQNAKQIHLTLICSVGVAT
jgi:hypothetical protein